MVSPDITSPSQLKGKTIATPQAGNTQDVALKKWLEENNLTDGNGPDAVTVKHREPAHAGRCSSQGRWTAAGCPSRGARGWSTPARRCCVDETTLWPDGKFPTTVLIVRTQFLQEHPETVEALLRGHAEVDRLRATPTRRRPRPS